MFYSSIRHTNGTKRFCERYARSPKRRQMHIFFPLRSVVSRLLERSSRKLKRRRLDLKKPDTLNMTTTTPSTTAAPVNDTDAGEVQEVVVVTILPEPRAAVAREYNKLSLVEQCSLAAKLHDFLTTENNDLSQLNAPENNSTTCLINIPKRKVRAIHSIGFGTSPIGSSSPIKTRFSPCPWMEKQVDLPKSPFCLVA